MLNDLQYISMFSHSTPEIVMNLAVALLCGLLIGGLYRATYRGSGYVPGFTRSLIMLSMITAVVIMIIGNNLARAFGLVGAMSIIRFRTAVKDTMDIIFIFFSLATGMAAGVGYYRIAIVATLFIGAVFLVISKTHAALPKKREYLLQFYSQTGGKTTPAYQNILDEYCRNYSMINVKSIEEHDLVELSYHIRLKDPLTNSEFVHKLSSIRGVRHVNLFFDQENF